MNEFEMVVTLNTDAENIGFLLITERKTKEQESYCTDQLNKEFINNSISDFINNHLR